MKLSHLSLGLCLFLPVAAYALSTDTEQPVYIDSDTQQLDMKSNKVTFAGDVKLKQGSININADTIIVTREPKTGALQVIEGFGDLATFSQLTDDGKTLYGEAKELHYALKDDQLTMTNQAMLSQDGSIIKGTKIRYRISSQKLIADGSPNERVSTVLQPQPAQE
ncbi:lipopolysaccharide transport periplasmic protein LptA [Vibrio sp. 10N.286.49.C2]|uniref:lipopolysaccharide transport periplasmic protein LptA n=1 Tax=unclassified Vibrio TaxID=2614977 RepID=UPI000C84165B|nr:MULTISPECIES: lipopolysaccharide transport periplasmic protein LptA [unclassified Vibrio]PMH34123.1 lipopolysaccharide transport periplasmic protein LptA [Vibrio sp. 10N.286.49.C2]PMH56832.1 lipopolysaccharide transport periplasmic protein LptA [Vibrio sp. 10N.286.49.B1]PMH83154.1 lipopolysaccharide transport periplasmic protein LptA [Vibrio sp. 10N.286.48.B7]